jgi:hypothetical protein
MIHFDAKHQKSEAKTKENKQKLSEKIEVKRKLTEKLIKMFFFSPENEIGKRNNAINI